MPDVPAPASPAIKLLLFGPVDVRRTDGQASAARAPLQPKRAAMLAWLAMAQPTGRRTRGNLFALFWPDLDDARARRALNQALHYLRQELGEGAIESHGTDQVALSSRIWCDSVAFEAALDGGRLEEAMLLYRGDFLEGLRTGDLVEFERWADDERTRLRARASAAAWTLADQAAGDDPAASLTWAQRATELSPELDEPSIRRLIATHDRGGDRAGAIRVFEEFADRLQREFDAEPAPETLSLVRAVRARVSQHATPPLGVPVVPVAAPSAAAPEPSSRQSSRQLIFRRASRTPRAQRIILGGMIALGVIASAGAWTLLQSGPPPSGTVAVLPFAYSGTPEQSHLAAAATALVASHFDGTSGLRSIDASSIANAVREEALPLTRARAETIARQFGAAAFVIGQVSQVGDQVRVAASLHAAEGWSGSAQSSADGAPRDLFSMVDRLSGELLAFAEGGAGRQGAATRRAAARTTTSLAALKAFLAGETDLRAGRFTAAAGSFRRAVMHDSTFALALLRLSIATNWIGTNAESDWAATRAMEHRERLGPHERRHVEAWHRYQSGEVLDARRLYREIVAVDSADIEGWLRLGEIAYHWGPMLGEPAGASRAEWSRVLALDARNGSALAHLARIAAREGRSNDFEALAGTLEKLEPDADQLVELGIMRAFSFGSDADRAAAMAPLVRLDPRVRADFIAEVAAAVPARPQTAELLMRAYFAGRNVTNWEGGQVVLQASAFLARGQLARAGSLLDTAMFREPSRVVEYRAALAIAGVPGFVAQLPALRKQLAMTSGPGLEYPLTLPWRLYLRGAAAIRVGDFPAGRDAVARMRNPAAGTDSVIVAFMARYARQLEAELRAAEGDASGALALLGSPGLDPDLRRARIWSQPRVHERLLRARLLEAVGRPREALAWYEGFPDPSSYDLAYLPLALVSRGRILRQLGDQAAASRVDRQLADLLATADAGYRAALPAPAVSVARR